MNEASENRKLFCIEKYLGDCNSTQFNSKIFFTLKIGIRLREKLISLQAIGLTIVHETHLDELANLTNDRVLLWISIISDYTHPHIHLVKLAKA